MARQERDQSWWPRQRQDRMSSDFRPSSYGYENTQQYPRGKDPRQWEAERDTKRSARMQDDLKRAIRYLLSLVNYNSIAARTRLDTEANPIPVNSALADAFDYIERLQGKKSPSNARELRPYHLFQDLRKEIPGQYLLNAGAERERLRIRQWIPSPTVLALAAAAWIAELKQRKERALEFAGGNAGRSRPHQEANSPDSVVNRQELSFVYQNARVDQQTSEQQVQNYLGKIELWMEQWEAGKVEWETMKDCLEMN